MKKNKKGSKKDFLSGFMNNISLFIITIIVSSIFAFLFKPTIVTYSICSRSRNTCDCGFNSLKFAYNPGLLHNIFVLLFVIVFIAIIACSIYFVIKSIKRKKVVEIIMNIIFAIFIGFIVYRLPYNFYNLDRKYGNNIQADALYDGHPADSYINESCGW